MNKEALAAGHEAKKAFLRKAIKARVYLQIPSNTSPDQWSKQRKVGFRYAFQDITLKELGRQYGGTRENSRVLNHHFLDNMHKNSPPKLQTQYPRETIPDSKPLSQKLRERSSQARGGLSLKVKELVEKGITDPKQIANTLAISTRTLGAIRITLRGWSIDIPRTHTSIKEIAERIEKEKDDKKLQEFLDSLSDNQLRGFLERYPNHELFTTVLAIAREKVFHVHVHAKYAKFIAEKVQTAKIPVRRIVRLDKKGELLGSYYIVYTKHTERIAEALINDPDLQRFK